MNPMVWLKCWVYGHEPDDSVTGFVSVLDMDLEISTCKYCNVTIVYDPHRFAWFKW